MKFFYFLILYSLTSCSSPDVKKYEKYQGSWQEFRARDQDASLQKPLIYRAFVPHNWKKKEPALRESIRDTKKAICEFFIEEREQKIHITLHTFPITHLTPHISCLAQIRRWQNQFDEINPLLMHISQVSHAGFCGLKLEIEGILKNQACQLIAWSMQLAPEHERTLHTNQKELDQYRLADYTIKVLGDPCLIKKHQLEIEKFAHSFELIEGLATSL